eukprot:3029178-Prymnesium_polylepis.1
MRRETQDCRRSSFIHASADHSRPQRAPATLSKPNPGRGSAHSPRRRCGTGRSAASSRPPQAGAGR